MNERIDFDPSSLSVTHVLLFGSTIWPQSQDKRCVFPQGILRTDNLPVALVPRKLTHFRKSGLELFYTTDEFKVEYPQHDHAIWTYLPPWILFGFLRPDNKLTVTIFSFHHPKIEKVYKQGSLM